ncbi:MAG: polysaccharide biosynthesis C-terminal domain-containing protein, partial [Moraxellaceae bacterium]|nr:polysaccharide biosynthesis C-terminal domain-containing protein [Moraxellaceae bacterium]
LVWHFKHVGLAFASTLSAFLNAGLLYWGLHKQGVYRLQKPWVALGLRYGLANMAMVGVLYWITPQANYWLNMATSHKLGYLAVICGAGAATYVVVLTLVGFKWRELKH